MVSAVAIGIGTANDSLGDILLARGLGGLFVGGPADVEPVVGRLVRFPAELLDRLGHWAGADDSVHNRMADVEKATEKLALELRRPPSTEELAADVRLDSGEVLEVPEVRHSQRPISLDAPPVARCPSKDDSAISRSTTSRPWGARRARRRLDQVRNR